MAVITISRELGSDGDRIADLLCKELGHCRVDKAMLSQIAKEAGVDVDAVLAMERSFAKRSQLISTEMTAFYRAKPTAFDGKGALDDQTYQSIVTKTIREYAQQGNVVIVGRGGQMILRDWPSALHVLVYASLEVRIQRLMERFSIARPQAERRISDSDEEKRSHFRRMYQNANWRDIQYYHLAINTAHVAPETAASIIILAAQDR